MTLARPTREKKVFETGAAELERNSAPLEWPRRWRTRQFALALGQMQTIWRWIEGQGQPFDQIESATVIGPDWDQFFERSPERNSVEQQNHDLQRERGALVLVERRTECGGSRESDSAVID